MKKFIPLLIIAFICHLNLSAQNAGIKGKLTDSSEYRNLQNSVVALLKAKDSSLVKFTRATDDGAFQINDIDTGDYILMATHPYFADFFDNVAIKKSEPLNIGIINMLSKIKLLEEVVVKSGAPIRIKGDTTIFTADSFHVREGANVEELLRKLPGIQVDRKGSITAMGETVKNVLVDGEEFFGNDPGIATKNLRADIVKEVEVYDKKSDQATFTGIDDGVKEKTINLKLKEDKKKGYFGKIELGGGLKDKQPYSQDKFNNAIMLNAFKAKRKIAAYGIMSNTGMLNLNWQDRDKYGGGGNVEMSDDGGIMIFGGGGDYNWSDGIPTNWNGGIHYSNKFNKDKQSLNAGYKFVKMNAPSSVRSFSRNFLPDSTWITNGISNDFNSNIRHSANLIFEAKIDSMNTIKWSTNGNINNSKSDYSAYSEALTESGKFINKSIRKGNSESDNSRVNSNLLWMHKFKKQYRTLSVNAGFNYSNSNSDAFVYSRYIVYKNDDSTTSIIDRETLQKNLSQSYTTRIAYTEPLMKDFYMELSYSLGISKNINDRLSNDNNGSGVYNVLVPDVSNKYEFNNISNTPGINFRMNKKKLNYSFGTTAGFTNYEQINVTKSLTRKYNFTNYAPRANVSYKIRPSENISLYYNGYSSAPSLNQLQPISDYTDQQNIYEGNPNLRPSFSHNFSLWYGSFKMLKERNIWAYIDYSFTQNAFTQYNEFKNSRRYYHDVNTDGVHDFSSNIEYGLKLKKAGLRLGFGSGVNLNSNVDYVYDSKTNATVKNTTNTNRYGLNLRINKDIPDKLDISFSPNIAYNTSQASVSTSANANYWSYGYNIWGNWQLPKDFELSTNVDASFRQKDPRFTNDNNFTIWNASFSKKFHKKEFEARISINDILDQNRGYRRNFSSYSFNETYRTTLRRFWMVSFIWNITKNNAAPAAK